MAAVISAISSQLGPCGCLTGANKWLAPVVLTLKVAVPVSEVGGEVDVKLMVPGAVKFESGAPKLQIGRSTAPCGPLLMPQVRVTAPLKLFAPTTVIKQDPDEPGEAIVIGVLVHGAVTLIPAEPTSTVTDGDFALGE